MPAGKESGGTEGAERRESSAADRRGSATVKRETFRPPWVKEGPDGLPPKPSNLWSKTRQASKDGGGPETATAPRRPSNVKANQAESQENGTTPAKEHTFVKPQLKPVPPKEPTKLQSREVKIPVKLNSVKDLPPEAKKPPLTKTNSINREDRNIDKAIPTERNAIIRQESLKKITAPKAPPLPPPAPAFPRSPDLKSLSIKQLATIEQLKARPKVRPDWTAMLKEVESGKKLRHVECNDRSKPLLPKVKVVDSDKEQFMYESEKKEKETTHNQLLKQIQQGVSLKKVKTNDRSRPVLEGLRKFRRQMTIEEQIQKSQSMASIPPEEITTDEADELDDIDKVRDDLQSTKQMLALELRNKEALNRDNKRLQTRIAQLEAEVEKEKANKKVAAAVNAEADEKLLTSLKSEAADARKVAEDLEKKYHEAANQLDNTKSELEEIRKQKQMLEKKLIDSVQGGKRLSLSDKRDSIQESEEEEEEAIESDSGGSDNEEKREKRAQREVKQLKSKLRSYKNKEDNAKKERMALKNQIKRLQQAMKEEKRKYKGLQKEVAKMDAMLKEVGGDSDEDEDEEKEKKEDEEETETETETESESESSETDSDSEKSMSEPEEAPADKKKQNLTKRTNKHEGRLSALKKGNYMLKTNVERLQDDLNKQKEESISLQHELDSVLSELG